MLNWGIRDEVQTDVHLSHLLFLKPFVALLLTFKII